MHQEPTAAGSPSRLQKLHPKPTPKASLTRGHAQRATSHKSESCGLWGGILERLKTHALEKLGCPNGTARHRISVTRSSKTHFYIPIQKFAGIWAFILLSYRVRIPEGAVNG